MKLNQTIFTGFLFLVLSFMISLKGVSQQTYASKNNGQIQIATIRSPYCGGDNDYVFKFINTTKDILDIGYYFKRNNGKWSDLRATNNVKPGEKFEGHSCESDGNIVLFIRISGSKDKFPRSDELNKPDKN